MKKTKLDRLISEGQNLDHNLTREEIDKNDELPEHNPRLSKIASELFNRNLFAFFNCMLMGLTALMYVPSIVGVLSTTKLSSNPIGSFVRYLSTSNHIIEWFKSPNEMMRSLKKVRSIHSKVNQLSVAENGQKMTQYDMVVTQWAFFAPAFIFPERMGIVGVTDEELKGLAHKLYLIGYVLGVRDEFNLCHGTLSDIRKYCREIHERIIKPCIEKPSQLSLEMSDAMLKGLNMINPFIHEDSFIAAVFELYNIKGKEEKVKQIGSVEHRTIFCIHIFVINKLLNWRLTRVFLRPIFSFLMNLNIIVANKLKGKVIQEHYNKFVTKAVSRFWLLQTKKNKMVATTVGQQWLELVRQKKKVKEIETKVGKQWIDLVRQRKLERNEMNENVNKKLDIIDSVEKINKNEGGEKCVDIVKDSNTDMLLPSSPSAKAEREDSLKLRKCAKENLEIRSKKNNRNNNLWSEQFVKPDSGSHKIN